MNNELFRAKYQLGVMLGHHVRLFYFWRKVFRPETSDRLVSNNTEIAIEGYPRSGNTFAVAAFQLAQKRPISIAHHTHKIAQVIEAVRMEVPTLVVIRNPTDAVVSLVIRYPHLTIPQILNNYIRYYNGLVNYRPGFMLSQFEDIISDFGTQTKKLNEKFGTDFLLFEHTDENVKQSFVLIEKMHRENTGYDKVNETTVARPSSHRNELKKEVKKLLKQNNKNRKLLDEAEELYLSYISEG